MMNDRKTVSPEDVKNPNDYSGLTTTDFELKSEKSPLSILAKFLAESFRTKHGIADYNNARQVAVVTHTTKLKFNRLMGYKD